MTVKILSKSYVFLQTYIINLKLTIHRAQSAVFVEDAMQVKLLLFGEAVNIPHTSIGLGIGLVSVWMDGVGFTTATNELGSLGFVFLNTPNVDVGTLDEDRQSVFSNLHGQVVKFDIKPSVFFRDGGNARVTMTVPVQADGGVVDKKLEFVADDIKGVSLVSNALSFSATMFMMEQEVADLDAIIVDEELEEIVAAAPVPNEGPVPA